MDAAKIKPLISILVMVAGDIVSQQFFDGLTGQTGANCEAKGFYTREAFMNAWGTYPAFGQADNFDATKREIAAFFAHVFHETIGMCYKEQEDKSFGYCDNNSPQYPCNPGKMYYGRGPLQISWNYNYGLAGQQIGFDGLNWPEAVSTDPVIAFKSALWFWMRNVHNVINQGFGATIRAINGAIECDGKNPGSVGHRIGLYLQYCGQFGVSPGDNLGC